MMKRSDSILLNFYRGKLPKYQDRPGIVDNTYKQGGRLPRYQDGNQVKLVTTDNKTYTLTPKDPLYHWFYGQRASSPGQSYIKTKNPDGSWNLSISSADIPSEYLEPYYSKVATGEPAIINVIPERKRAAQAREAVISGNEDAEFAFPDGSIKKWKDMNWREQQYVAGKNMGSWTNNNWTDFINPVAWIGSMGEGLATAPYIAKQTDSYLPYILGVGAPLLTGALAGIGAKGTGQFIENVVSPIPARVSDVGQFLTEKTPLQYAYKLNPKAFTANPNMLYRGIGEEGLADVLEAGYFRGKQNVPRVNFPGTNLNASKSFGNTTYWSPRFETAAQYGQGVVAEVPKDVTKFLQKYRKSDWSQFTTNKIPLDQATILRKHWWKGYKPINIPGGRSINLNAASVKPSIIPQEITAENIGNIVDLEKDITGGIGNFNFGIYPTKDNPNILLKLDDIAGLGDKTIWGKIDDDEIAKAIKNWKTGLPETMKNIDDPNVSRMLAEYYIPGLSKTGIHPRLQGLNARTPNLDIPVAGRLITRVEGKPMIYGDFDLEELANLPPSMWQDVLDRLRMLHSNKLGVDMYGDNILLQTGVNKPSLSLVDLAGTKQIIKPGKIDVSEMYGFSQGAKGVDVRNIQGNLWDRINTAVNNASQRAGEGAYSTEQISDILDRLKNDIYKIKKQGGPVVNPRGYMDGQPPKGSNWRIPGDGMGTSITMDLPNMPDEILVVPDGDFDQAKVMKRGDEEYFAGADFVDEYTMKGGGLTPNKAREILHDGTVHGRPLTEKQRRFFGAMSKGNTKKYQLGGNALAMLRDYGGRMSLPGDGIQFLKDMANSPLFGERYAAMTGKSLDKIDNKEIENYRSSILSNLKTLKYAPVGEFPPEGFEGIAGAYISPGKLPEYYSDFLSRAKTTEKRLPEIKDNKNKKALEDQIADIKALYEKKLSKTHRIYIKPEYNYPSVVLHEESHGSTKGRDELKFGAKAFEFDVSRLPDSYRSVYEKQKDYLTIPTEQKARRDLAARYMMDEGLWDPINERFTKEHYNKLKSYLRDLKRKQFSDYKSVDPMLIKDLEEISYPYSEEEVIRLFNSFVKAPSLNSPLPKAQLGFNVLKQNPKLVEYIDSLYKKNGGVFSKIRYDDGGPVACKPGEVFYMGRCIPKEQYDQLVDQNLQKYVQQREAYLSGQYGDLATQSGVPTRGQMERDAELKRRAAELDRQRKNKELLDKYRRNQPTIGPADTRESTRITKEFMDAQRKRDEAIMNSALAQTFAARMPGGAGAGLVGAEFFTNTVFAPITGAGRLTQQALGYNPYGFGESTAGNVLGGLGVAGDIAGIGLAKLLPKSIGRRTPTDLSSNAPVRGEYFHGSTSANLPLVTKMQGLKPFGELEKLGLRPFTGELSVGILPGGVNRTAISAANMENIDEAVKYAIGLSGRGKVDVQKKLNDWFVGGGREQYLKDWSTALANESPYIGKPEILDDLFNIRLTQFQNLSKADKKLLSENFPVLYGIKPSPGKKLTSVTSSISGERGIQGGASFDEIQSILVPKRYIKTTQKLLGDKTTVLPMESALTSEQLSQLKTKGFKNGGSFGAFGYVGKGWYKNGGQHGGLDRWFAEKWVDIKTGKPCGRQEGESRAYPACRPSRRVSSKTPKTSGEMSSSEKAKFKSSKTSSQRIPYNHKRR